MKQNIIFAATVCAFGLLVVALNTGGKGEEPPPTFNPSKVAYGRHLVENIALCADCHTPRADSGELDRKQWLAGALIGFAPLAEMPWASYAPSLGMLNAYSDEQVLDLLMRGLKPDGSRPLPPMPQYRFKADEADAVLAYLRSISSSQ